MSYLIIQPPFTLKFKEMSKNELKAYREWFHKVTPERIVELAKDVQSTPGFELWEPDMTPESLVALGQWFEGQVQTRCRTLEEIKELKSKITIPIDVPEEDLTNRTFSLAMDIGMYFGQVVLRNLYGTQWEQPLKNKKFIDYGQPVLIGFGVIMLNPIRIILTTAYGISCRQQNGERLRELYDIWAKMRAPLNKV